MMNRALATLVFLICSILFAPIAHAQSIELRLNDGTRWRGEVGNQVELRAVQRSGEMTLRGEVITSHDLYLQVRSIVAGETRTHTIFKADIRSIRTLEEPQGESRPRPVQEPAARRTQPEQTAAKVTTQPRAGSAGFKGVFLLPWTGMVGSYARVNEIEAIIAEADKHGPGQIIVLQIDSPGGVGLEMQEIANTIIEAKQRHRIIAWVRSAISAAAATAGCCNEIYFATEGTLGAMTGHVGGGSIGREMQTRSAHYLGQWFESGGRPAVIAHAMVLADQELSYDKDDETGRVTWRADAEGEHVLSAKGQNLVFNSSNAVHSGFAQGVADTYDDLAELLNLPEWREVNDLGRRLHESWHRTLDQAKEALRVAWHRYNNPVGRDQIERLGYQIRQLEEMSRWVNRAPNVQYEQGVPAPDSDWLDRQIEELRKELADIQRQQRRGGGRR